MPRIVSGLAQDYQDPGLAFLKGYEGGTARARQEREEGMERARLMLQIQDALAQHKSEQARALADVNARVQMGDAQALQQQSMEAQAANLPPETKRLQEMAGVLAKITDPKARAVAIEEFERYSQEIDAHKQRSSAEQGIQRAVTNGLEVDPEELMLRLDSGEDPQALLQELGKMEQQRTIATMATQRNQNSLAQAQALLEAFPDGPERLMAEAQLTEYMNDVDAQAQPGSGPEMLRRVQESLIRGQGKLDVQRSKQEAEHKKAYEAKKAESPEAADEYLEARLQNRPYKPTAAKLKAEKEKRYPGASKSSSAKPKGGAGPEQGYSVEFSDKPPGEAILRTVRTFLDQGMNEKDLVDALAKSGVPGTPENRAIVKKALQERSRGAAAE